MPLSKGLVQPYRKSNILVGAGWRAFFAPFNIEFGAQSAVTTDGPKILDLQKDGPFSTNSPPAGWFDLGWIKDFRPAPESKIGQVRSGYRGAVRSQYRGQVGESFEFKFREMTRMAYKISTGTNIFNLLDNATASVLGPLSGSGAQAVPLHASGYQAAGAGLTAGRPTVFVPAASGTLFAVNQYIVVDIDYDISTSGLVGDTGTPVFPGAVVDVDYIRKNSDYVSRVIEIVSNAVTGADGLVLSGVLVGGGSGETAAARTTPPNTAKVQKIKGFASREGGTFITEWSALFICDTLDQAQIAFYYPHVSAVVSRGMPEWAIENVGTTDLTGYELDCMLAALAFDDPIDGETVVAYRAFYPSGRVQALQI